MIEDDPDDFYDGPSKSELKRQSQKLQDLGEQLIGLPQNEFDELPLPDNLREAVALARRITAHGGLYRQKQYIGKLMRNLDAEPIRAALEQRNIRQRAETLKLRRIETLRAQLIDSEGTGLDALLEPYPGLDRRTVVRLVAQARSERDRGQPPRASRELFGILRNGLEESG
jgi:ribosome-associated protein